MFKMSEINVRRAMGYALAQFPVTKVYNSIKNIFGGFDLSCPSVDPVKCGITDAVDFSNCELTLEEFNLYLYCASEECIKRYFNDGEGEFYSNHILFEIEATGFVSIEYIPYSSDCDTDMAEYIFGGQNND